MRRHHALRLGGWSLKKKLDGPPTRSNINNKDQTLVQQDETNNLSERTKLVGPKLSPAERRDLEQWTRKHLYDVTRHLQPNMLVEYNDKQDFLVDRDEAISSSAHLPSSSPSSTSETDHLTVGKKVSAVYAKTGLPDASPESKLEVQNLIQHKLSILSKSSPLTMTPFTRHAVGVGLTKENLLQLTPESPEAEMHLVRLMRLYVTNLEKETQQTNGMLVKELDRRTCVNPVFCHLLGPKRRGVLDVFKTYQRHFHLRIDKVVWAVPEFEMQCYAARSVEHESRTDISKGLMLIRAALAVLVDIGLGPESIEHFRNKHYQYAEHANRLEKHLKNSSMISWGHVIMGASFMRVWKQNGLRSRYTPMHSKSGPLDLGLNPKYLAELTLDVLTERGIYNPEEVERQALRIIGIFEDQLWRRPDARSQACYQGQWEQIMGLAPPDANMSSSPCISRKKH